MTFEDIQNGEPIYLDANVLLYCIGKKSRSCLRLFQRCMDNEVLGFTSATVLAEMCHRLMCLEAKAVEGKQAINAKYLKSHPELVQRLRLCNANIQNIVTRGNLCILPVTADQIARAQTFRQQYGFMTNDSITLQIMMDNGISSIATNDADFERVEGIRVFKPSDIP
ncbi:MAG: type II toxin-antitoxin system VapC family toxin [Candidatus Sumerlaeia bacterium]|nr:type II toxin-antitoxin system VapC family toxin [Candidatus Sumerlaeia bacterium]